MKKMNIFTGSKKRDDIFLSGSAALGQVGITGWLGRHIRALDICGVSERKARDSARQKWGYPPSLCLMIMDAFGILVTIMFLQLDGNELPSLC